MLSAPNVRRNAFFIRSSCWNHGPRFRARGLRAARKGDRLGVPERENRGDASPPPGADVDGTGSASPLSEEIPLSREPRPPFAIAWRLCLRVYFFRYRGPPCPG